ncbi:MAG: hypothetical protein WCB18_03965 [Thermoplasmata archaeon]
MSESERVRMFRRSFEGAVTLVIGLAFVAIGAEAFGFLNACVANLSCVGSVSTNQLNEYTGLILVGILVAVFGVVDLVIDLRPEMFK